MGFRVAARSVAHTREVTGWVRNQSDGSVLLEVQGSDQEVAAYLKGVRERLGTLITQETAQELAPVPGNPLSESRGRH